ncbi:MAG: response regulator receiver modulated serine phosphatase [Bryobacterales bacterium]|nr:response regulator receiver modulated serine phosphatase [Bryobacterales bacterium]
MAFKILVVDDEPDVELLIRQTFRRKIRDGEFDFEFALNGEEALAKLNDDASIDIVMSDINMPVMDGLTLLSRLSTMDRVLRTVMVSAYGDMQNIRIAMNRGAYDFLTKPIDFEDFEITIQKTIREIKGVRDGHHARKQLEAINSELSVAARIQQSMLPRRFPPFPDRSEFEVYAEMQPASSVGGDFYDFFLIDGERFGFVIGDVSGKGVPAALFMAATRTLLRATAMQAASAAECIRYVNKVLARQSDGPTFVTLFYGILDTRSGQVDYCNAGHHPPYVVSPRVGLRKAADGGGTIAGIDERAHYEGGSVLLAPGESLVLFTDGALEAFDSAGEMFDEERIEQALNSFAHADVEQIVKGLMREVRGFVGAASASDDMTALAVRYLG